MSGLKSAALDAAPSGRPPVCGLHFVKQPNKRGTTPQSVIRQPRGLGTNDVWTEAYYRLVCCIFGRLLLLMLLLPNTLPNLLVAASLRSFSFSSELCTSRSDRERVLSPFVWRTVLALKHKGFDLKRIPITFTEKDLIAFSKQSLVPVIIDPNNPSVPFVNDSNKIAKYLDDQYPNLPSLKGPAPALNEFIVAWVGTTIQPLMAKLTFDDARELLDEDGKKWWGLL